MADSDGGGMDSEHVVVAMDIIQWWGDNLHIIVEKLRRKEKLFFLPDQLNFIRRNHTRRSFNIDTITDQAQDQDENRKGIGDVSFTWVNFLK